jgi:hypothetical protein
LTPGHRQIAAGKRTVDLSLVDAFSRSSLRFPSVDRLSAELADMAPELVADMAFCLSASRE